MTTWDMFCLKRNADELGWTKDQIQPIFYRKGRIEPIPEHYAFVGIVLHVWEHAFGFLPESQVKDGCRMAVEIEERMFEFTCSSLNVDEKEVDIAEIGSNCGIASDCKSVGIKKNQRLFLVG